MRNTSKIAAALAVAATLIATAMPAQAELKIITIRAAELVQASPQFKTGQQAMKTEFERRKNDLETEAKKLADDVNRFKKEADVMSGEARAKAEKELQTRKIDFEYKQRQFGEDFQKRDRELSEKLMNNIKEIVIQVAKEQNASLVLQDPVYAAPGIDVTDVVIKRLQSGAGAAK